MSDPFVDQGLTDRTRVIPPDPSAEHISVLQVDKLIIGGYEIFAGQGTRAANGKLWIKGRDANSSEVKFAPADDCHGKGIMSEVEFISEYATDSFKRFGISVRNDGIGELVTLDSSSHKDTYTMPVYLSMGAKSNSDGTDVPNTDHLALSFFGNGTHELHLKDDTLRVELASFAEAFLTNDRTKIVARELVNGAWQPVTFNNPTIDGL